MDDEQRFAESFNRLADFIDERMEQKRQELIDDLRNVRSHIPAEILRVYEEHCVREHWREVRKERLRRLMFWRRRKPEGWCVGDD